MPTDSYDRFMDALENMIDAQDDMWEEEKYSNVKQVLEIKTNRYEPARQEAREALRNAIRKEIQSLMDR